MLNGHTNVCKLLKKLSMSGRLKFIFTDLSKMGLSSKFENVVNLIADCDGEEVKSHILNAPGNT